MTDGTNRITDANTTNVKQPCSDSITLAIDRNVTVPPIIPAPCFSRFIDAQVPNLMMLLSTITEGVGPNITVTIHSVQTPTMLDTGAELSVISRAMMVNFDPSVPLPTTFKEVRTFGNNQVTLRGPLPLELQLCGMRVRPPFYFVDVPTPVIGGYDLIRAARLVIDADNRLVWSRRPESTTLGLVGHKSCSPDSKRQCVLRYGDDSSGVWKSRRE